MQDINQIREQEAAEVKLKKRLDKIGNTIMVMSGKGGVGKSTVSANLAVGLAKRGFRVGLIDADIHGPNIPKVLGIENQELLADEEGNIVPVEMLGGKLKVVSVGYLIKTQDTPVIWRGPVKHGLISQFVGDVKWDEIDFLVVDLPPGTGDEPLSVAQVIKSVEGVHQPSGLVVTTPQDVALLDARKTVEFAGILELGFLGIIENMSGFVCPHCGERIDLFKVGGGQKAAAEMGVPFLGAVPLDPQVVIDTDAGKPFMLEDQAREVQQAFGVIVDNVVKAFGI